MPLCAKLAWGGPAGKCPPPDTLISRNETAFGALGNRSGAREELLAMHLDIVTLQPLIALVFGILILIVPRILNYLIAIYLILIGVLGLFPHLFSHLTG
jgi:hypothetical protein